MNDADFFLSAKGECYNGCNTFGDAAYRVKYPGYDLVADENNQLTLRIKSQRIMMDMPLTFYVRDKKQGTMLFGLNLLGYLLKAQNAEGEYIYKNQEDLDRIYIHHIKLAFSGDLTVRIFIDGWEVEHIHPIY